MLTYVWPLFLAIAADSGLGKFKTIAIAISVYVVGMIVASLGTMPGLSVQSRDFRSASLLNYKVCTVTGIPKTAKRAKTFGRIIRQFIEALQ